MILLMFAAGWIFNKYSGDNNESDALFRAIVFVAIWGVYEPVSQTLGCTLGNYLMKIRVRKNSNEDQKINLIQAYARFVVKFLLGWLSFLTIGLNEKRRAIHDFASGTVMIEK
jgi:uncharacterized RDD family membrane protein YckC